MRVAKLSSDVSLKFKIQADKKHCKPRPCYLNRIGTWRLRDMEESSVRRTQGRIGERQVRMKQH